MDVTHPAPAKQMSRRTWASALSAIQKFFWILFLLGLTVTSFPFFPPTVGGGALVRPISVYPLIGLLLLVTLPRLVSKPLPKTLVALLPFAAIALISTMLALLRGIQPTLGVSVTDRMLRALITLGIGGAIYVTVSLFPRTPADLRSALRWLYAGFSLALLWGSLQAVYIIHYIPQYYRWMNRLQRFISTRRLFATRASGLTYEPNWFAEQIAFLLLPWLLASVLSGYSVFRWRWRWVTVEWLLLIWAVVVLAFTFSRAGLVILIVLAFLGLLFFRTPRPGAPARRRSFFTGWPRRLLEASLVVSMLAGFIFLTGLNNTFFARIWGYWSDIKNTSISGYFNYIGFGARFIYAETAFRAYEQNPILGIGLGNYAFVFNEMLPDTPLAVTPEVLRLVTPDAGRDRLITTKNLYLRLLAETGLLGTAAFMAFVVAILGCALFLWLARDPEQQFWGKAGLLGLIAFSMSALSFDSFTVPNMWVVLGLITAAAWVFRNTCQEAPA